MGKLFFVVDDDPDDRELFYEALRETDSTATYQCARNGQEALDLLSRPDQAIPDYIVLDINMPRMDGRQCLIRLRAMPRFDEIPIIIFTTVRPDDKGAEYKRLGASLCMTKPTFYAGLKQTLGYIISDEWKPANYTRKS